MGHDGEGKMIEVAMMNKLRAGVKNKIEIGLPGESSPPLPTR
jgi:23S rRNA G2445 N2-methylase RlmL